MHSFRGLTILATCLALGMPLWADDHPAAQIPDDALGAGTSQGNGSSVALGDGSLAKVMDAFLRAYAADKLEWRVPKDVKLGIAEDSTLPDGWQKAHHPIYGWFAFRPKTSDMLTIDERRALIRDPRFPRFVAQMRVVADGKTPPLSDTMKLAANEERAFAPDLPKPLGRAEVLARLLEARKPMPDIFSFSVSPAELLMPSPMVVSVAPDPSP